MYYIISYIVWYVIINLYERKRGRKKGRTIYFKYTHTDRDNGERKETENIIISFYSLF